MSPLADEENGSDAEQAGIDSLKPDQFISRLDDRLRKRNERLFEKMLAWGELLDWTGWCVALNPAGDRLWVSEKARQDLLMLGVMPASWRELSALLAGISPIPGCLKSGGVLIWPPRIPRRFPPGPAAALTRREAEVMSWLREGKTTGEIAIILGCAVRTVEKHLANLYRKTGAKNRATVILQSPNS